MKKMILMFMVLFASMTANAQVFYKCTGDNVNVRTGPGKNYKNVINQGFETRCQLFKDNIVRYAGKKSNGFVYVMFSNCGMTGASCYPDYGWVSSQYLKPMTHKCRVCNGKGYFNRPCGEFGLPPEEHPSACPCSGVCLNDGCKGKQHCRQCGGVGYY